MAELRSVKLAPPWRGVNNTDGRNYLTDGTAVDMENILPGTTGRAIQRGSFSGIPYLLGTTKIISGMWVNSNDEILTWLGDASKLARLSDPLGKTDVTPSTSLSSSVPAGRCVRIGSNYYGLTTNSDLMGWNGSGTVTSFPSGNPPRRPKDCIAHLERLFVLGGTIPGTGTAAPNSIFYTDPGVTDISLLASWQDDYSGLVNRIDVPLAEGDEPQCLGLLGQNLAIFCTNAIYVLYGQTPASFSLRRAYSGHGTTRRDSVLSHGSGCFFQHGASICYFDGDTVTTVSDPIERDLGQTSYLAVAARLSADYLYFLFLPPDFHGIGYVLHVPTRTWTKFTMSEDLSPDGPNWVATRSDGAVIWDGAMQWDMANSTVPFNLLAVPKQDQISDLDPTRPIPASFRTRDVDLASPVDKVQLNRIHVDYVLNFGLMPDPVPAWTLEVVDSATDTVLLSKSLTAVQAADYKRQRLSFDVFGESRSLYVRMTLPDTEVTPDLALIGSGSIGQIRPAEIGDIVIEYQVSHRST